jgi:hypothetical protein
MATVRQRPAHSGRSSSDETIVEKGDIFFAYRPRVGEDKADGLADVQRFFMVLKPEGQSSIRLAVLGRKRLPQAEEHERVWGFIDRVAKSGAAIGDEFKEHRYSTKTRGERSVPAARPAGEGVYALLQRGRNLHLTYELELPRRAGEVQEEFNIPQQGAYILSIANPERPAPPSAGLPEREEARYPKSLQQEFHGRRFATADPRLLDYEGAEFILIGARTDPERAYDIDIAAEHESAAKADIFRQLKMSRGTQPLEPLLEGEWR